MNKELWKLVEQYRKNGIQITDEDAWKIYKVCVRKTAMKKVECKMSFLEILYEEELKNFAIRSLVNDISIALMTLKEAI